MRLARIGLKLYATVPEGFSAERVIPVFHAFIRDRVLDDVLVDVADYTHVHHGPGVVLIGHGADFYLDLGEGRPGLLFSRKREGPDGATERIIDAFRRALAVCEKLEPELGVRFGTDEARFTLIDRLEAKNDDAGFAALRSELEAALARIYADVPFELAREGSDRDVLTVRIRARGAPDVAALRARLSR